MDFNSVGIDGQALYALLQNPWAHIKILCVAVPWPHPSALLEAWEALVPEPQSETMHHRHQEDNNLTTLHVMHAHAEEWLDRPPEYTEELVERFIMRCKMNVVIVGG